MRLRRRRPQRRVRDPGLVDELRSADRRLTGWKWTGTEELNLHGLLRRAARELDAQLDAGEAAALLSALDGLPGTPVVPDLEVYAEAVRKLEALR